MAKAINFAALRISIPSTESVDSEKGIVRGCIMAKAGKLAVFAGKDGNPVELMIRPELINSLLSLAKTKGRLDAFWTHDRLASDNDRDDLHDKIGVWKNFRNDESGNLVADLQLAPTDYKERVLWAAVNDPEGIMTSLVFGYTGGRDKAIATSITSGDLVSVGAGTEALLSAYPLETKPSKSMAFTDEQKQELAEIISAALANYKPTPADPESDDTTAAEAAMGITEDDKKAEDEKLPNSAKFAVWSSRAQVRLTKQSMETLKDEAVVLAEAKLSTAIGTGKIRIPAQAPAENTALSKFKASIDATISAGAARSRGGAIAILARANPEGYQAYLKSQHEA